MSCIYLTYWQGAVIVICGFIGWKIGDIFCELAGEFVRGFVKGWRRSRGNE